jgi:putative endonuclease
LDIDLSASPMMKYFVYIVQAKDKSFYTGSTRNLTKRIREHNFSFKGAKSLRGKRPVRLVYQEECSTWPAALKREREIKGWNRKKKILLIEEGSKKS